MANGDKCRVPHCIKLVKKIRGTLCETHRYRWEKFKSFDPPIKKMLPDGIVKICKNHGELTKDKVNTYKVFNKKNAQISCATCDSIKNIKSKNKYYNERKDEINKKRKQTYNLNLEKNHDQNRKRRFGITKQEYLKMLADHNNVCAICLKPETATRSGRIKNLCIDHCHESEKNGVMKIRGLLCSRCNIAFGAFKESIEILQNAIKYAKKYNN